MRCQICGAPSTEFHFGVYSCRACAAFFRRYVNSPKKLSKCICSRNPLLKCRFCRMNSCLKAGMVESKVQQKRDANPCRADSVPRSEITLRNNDRISRTLENYRELPKERKQVHKMSPAKKVNMFEFTSIAIIDSRMIWKLLENSFLELEMLGNEDKLNLFSNFFPKWTLFESALIAFQKSEVRNFYAPNGKPAKQISKFYKDCMNFRMKDAEVLRIFEPYWNSYYRHVAYPIFELKFDQMEHMAILAIMLLDPAYTNISTECSEMCYNLRKVMQAELIGYYLENDLPQERLFHVLEAILLMEKADSIFQEEIYVCIAYNVSINDEFRRMVMAPKL